MSTGKISHFPIKLCSAAEKASHGGHCAPTALVHFKKVPQAKTQKFVAHPNSLPSQVKAKANPFESHSIRQSGVGMLNNKGEMVGLHAYEATESKGQEFLQTNQKKLGLALIECNNGTRVFVAAGQAKNFTTISTTQQIMEKYGAIVRKQDGSGFFYEATKPTGEKFLKQHPEISQRRKIA